MADDETHFEGAHSGASQTYPKQCSALRKNECVLIKGRPCKIVEMSTSKTGKHGHAKVHIVAIDIFTGKKYEDICPSTHNMEVPNTKRVEYMVVGSNDGYLSLMDDSSNIREDLKIPDKDTELGPQIIARLEKDEDFMVTVLSAMNEECVVGVKDAKN